MSSARNMIRRSASIGREWVGELPSYVFHALLWWVYPTRVLRLKAAVCPYPHLRELLLRRSGIAIEREVDMHFGVLVVGTGRTPPAVTLKARCAIGPNVTFVTSSYPGYSKLNDLKDVKSLLRRFAPIVVEEDAWIGASASILPGITIGRCAIVGSGAVVTRDVAPYTVVAGVPARVLRELSAEEVTSAQGPSGGGERAERPERKG